jgi:hypothetical protein
MQGQADSEFREIVADERRAPRRSRTKSEDRPERPAAPEVPQEGPTWLEVVGLVVAATIAAVCLASLLLAWAGAHDGLTALLIGLAVGLVLAVGTAFRKRDWSIAPWSWSHAGLLALLLVVGAVLFFPGFPYAAKNRDPGVYINHAVAIADQGSTTLDDPVADTGAELTFEDDEAKIVTDAGTIAWRKLPYRAFPTEEDDLDHILPDFFHLWPASLATAKDVAGTDGMFNLTPALALVALGLFWLATRRAFGVVAGTVAAGLLVVNELQVWQAKYPTAEAMEQFFYAGALLGVVLAFRTRWRFAALVGGAFVGMGFVARPEGILIVGIAAVILAFVWAFRPLQETPTKVGLRDPWTLFALGLLPPLLIGTYQAYGTGSRYVALQEGLPNFAGALAGALALTVVAVALRIVLAKRGSFWAWFEEIDPDKIARIASGLLFFLFAAFMVLAILRPQLSGQTFRVDKDGNSTRGYDELNLERLLIFITPLALAGAVAGLWLAWKERWDAARWLLVLPGVLVAPVLIWEPHIAPDLMWWTRRYVPIVIPTFLVLVGACAAWLWERTGDRQRLLRIGTTVVVLLMGAYTLRQTTDIWRHKELDGSLQVIEQLDDALPDDAVVVWQGGSRQNTNFAITPFTWMGLPAIAGPPAATEDDLRALQRALDGRPLYFVADGDEAPDALADALEPVTQITEELSEFEHSFTARPRRARHDRVNVTVWHLTED